MAALATDITPQVTTLCDRAFDAFCEDMAGMFDTEMRCERRQAALGTVQGLQEHFKKLTAVHSINAEGALRGAFHLMFDAGGVFVLGGVIVMLPEPRIREGMKRGSLQDADSLQDAAREAGNLLVGSWDRVFRTECPGHKHFLKSSTFIGKPWEGAGHKELQSQEQALVVWYDVTVEPYPSFQCAAVFPHGVLEGLGGAEREPVASATRIEEAQAREPTAQVPAVPASPAPASKPAAESRPAPAAGPAAPPAIPKVASGGAGPRDVPPEVKKPSAPDPEPQTQAPARVPPAAFPGSFDTPFLDPTYVLSTPRSADRALTDLLAAPAARIMEKEVVWAGPDDTVQDVIAQMQQHNVGYVLVGHNGALEGLVSSSNILGAVSLYLRPLFAKWHRPEDDATLRVKVKWIMSRPVRTVRPDATVAGLIESMRRCGGRCLPVVDAGGTVQGIVTVFDILVRLLEAQGSGSWQGRPPQAPALLL